MFFVTRHLVNASCDTNYDSCKYTHSSRLNGSDEKVIKELDCIKRNMPFKFRLFRKGIMVIEGYCDNINGEPFDYFKSFEHLKLDELKHMTDGVWVTYKCPVAIGL